MRALDLVITPCALRFLGRRIPCTIGRAGITGNKAEGDGATPRGIHRVTGMLYRADRIALPAAWAVPIGPRDLWSDDPSAPGYNTWVRAPYAHGHERLRRGDHLYDLVVLTDWNWPRPVKGAGSAIFIHRWRKPGHPTEGCIALRPDHLAWVAARIGQGTRIVVL